MVGMALEDSEKYKSHSCHLWKSWCRSNLEEVKIFLVERSKEWIFFAKIGNLKNLGQSIFGLGRQKFVVLRLSLTFSLPLSPSNSLYSKGSHSHTLSVTLAHCFHLFLALVCQSLLLSCTRSFSHTLLFYMSLSITFILSVSVLHIFLCLAWCLFLSTLSSSFSLSHL